MSVHFYPLAVKEVRKETYECVSIAFDIPCHLQELFKYRHGQYITIKASVNGKEVRRSYSICSSPLDNELRIAVKKVYGGVFSAFAFDQLKKGDVLEAMPPLGKFFTALAPANKKSYVAFAAGSGITPVISIIKTTLYTEPLSTFTLVFGNKNRQSIIFREELEALKNRFIDRFRIIHVLSREEMDTPINCGRINHDKCAELFKNVIDVKSTHEFFVCGPVHMIFSVKELLQMLGVNEKQIHTELFTSPNLKKPAIEQRINSAANQVESTITIRLDGVTFDIKTGFNSDSILDAALKNGVDLPFACKGGVCSTCRAKLLEGKVEMMSNFSLEKEELEKGFILTCQSHPYTEKVVIDFDIK